MTGYKFFLPCCSSTIYFDAVNKTLHFILLFLAIQSMVCRAQVTLTEHLFSPNATGSTNVGAGSWTNGDPTYMFTNDFRVAQSFVPVESGFLDIVAFNVYRDLGDQDLRVSITTVNDGQPATVLDTVLLPSSSVGSNSIPVSELRLQGFSHSVRMSGSLYLQSGVQYALVFSSDHFDGLYRIYEDHNEYAGGIMSQSRNGGPYVPSRNAVVFFRLSTLSSGSEQIRALRQDDLVHVAFHGVLQEREDLADDLGWVDLQPQPVSPYPIPPGKTKAYFRVRP